MSPVFPHISKTGYNDLHSYNNSSINRGLRLTSLPANFNTMTIFYRTCIIFCVLISFSMITRAQAPQGISYQAVARNSAGSIIINQNISLRFTVHDVTATGTVVYRETQAATTNSLGLFNLFVGKGTPVTNLFKDIVWAVGDKFLQVELDASGGSSYLDMGTQQMMSVPYAVYADKAGNGVKTGAALYQTTYFNGSQWDSTGSITNNVAAGKVNVKGTLSISPDSSLTDTKYSLQIASAKPMMLAKMTQAQIDALSPDEGMEVFNSTTHKKQLYALASPDIINDLLLGTFTNNINPGQTFIPPISGTVTSVEVYIKLVALPSLNVALINSANTVLNSVTVNPANNTYAWVAIPLTGAVSGGQTYRLSFNRGSFYSFGTNSSYISGSVLPATTGDDIMFKVHITPAAPVFSWQNLN